MKGLFLSSRKLARDNRGFSLVELIVVIAIMAILAGVGVAGYTKYIAYANKKADSTMVGNVMRAIETASYAEVPGMDEVAQLSTSGDGLMVPVGMILLSHDDLNESDTEEEYVKIINPQEGVNEDLIDKILKNSYNENYKNELHLKSEEWTNVAVPTFYANVDDLFESVKSLTRLLSNSTVRAGLNALKPGYLSSSMDEMSDVEILSEVAKGTTSIISQEDFISIWNDVDSNGGGECAFGLNSAGAECYTAARRAYNEGFASYVKTTVGEHSSDVAESHASSIASCGFSAPIIISLYPYKKIEVCASDTFCKSLIGSDKTGRYDQGSLKDEVQACTACSALYEDYLLSDVIEENGVAYYQTMVTIAESADGLIEDGADVWTTYDTFVNMLKNSYNEVLPLTNGKSCVLITIYLEDGLFKCEASPLEADPRAEANQ